MKQIILISLTVFILIGFTSCELSIPDANKYTELNDATNDSRADAEVTGFIITSDAFEISGSISSAADADYYLFEVSNLINLEIKTFWNDEEQTGILGFTFFPLSYIEYNAADVSILIHLLAADSDSDIDAETSYIVLNISGNADYSSGDYRIELHTGV